MRTPGPRQLPILLTQAALLGFLGPALLSATSAAQNPPVVLAGGPKGGVYDHLAEGIRKHLPGNPVRITSTPDCAESLAWIEDPTGEGKDEVRFAFVQQDIVGDHFRRSADTPVRVVGPVTYEYLHIFVREDLRVEFPASLQRLRVWAGEEDSATRFTASHLLGKLGVRLEKPLAYKELEGTEGKTDGLQVEDDAVRQLPEWLGNNQLDVAMLMAPAGAPDISGILVHGKCSLLPLSPGTRRILHEDGGKNPFLRHIVFGPIPRRTYFNQRQELSTIAVPVLLVARTGTDPALATNVLEVARQEWESLTANSMHLRERQAPTAPWKPKSLADAGLKLLEGIGEPPATTVGIGTILAFAAPVLTGFLLYKKRRRLRVWFRHALQAWQRHPLLYSLVLMVGAMGFITWRIYRAEHDFNESFSTFWESWWSITVYLFSGVEDRAPYTRQGRIFVTAAFLLGAFCSTFFTSWLTALLLRRERKMSKRVEGHYLLLNWNERGKDLIRELHHPVLREHERTATIVVLSDAEGLTLQKLKRTDNPSEEAFDQVYLHKGDPTDAVSLEQARALSAKTIVILANERHGDEGTLRSILQLRKLARAAVKKDLHVVAELSNASNEASIRELAIDFPGLLESVSGLQMRTYLLSQAALNRGIVGFYKDLLSVEAGTNEVYSEPIPLEAVGMSFQQYAAVVIAKSSAAAPIIPVGIQREENDRVRLLTNPKAGKDDILLKKDDQLVLISYGPPGEPLPPPDAPPRSDRLGMPSPSGPPSGFAPVP